MLGERRKSDAGASTASGSPAFSAWPSRRNDRRIAQMKNHHLHALHAIRHFLRTRSSYDVLPVSFRLVVLDTKLTIKSALDVMFQSGVVSAPLWRSTLSDDEQTERPVNEAYSSRADGRPGFSGMITVHDIIHLIQYYYLTASNYVSASLDVETLRLERLREIEETLKVPPPPLLWIGPLRSLAEAGELLVRTHARRIPLLDFDEDLGVETVVSVLTQYRLLKFIAMNCHETSGLRASIGSLGIGTYTYEHIQKRRQRTPLARLKMGAPPPPGAGPYWPIQTASLDTPVSDIVHIFSEKGISAVPILDKDGDVVDIYESVDVITLVRTGAYYQLDLTIQQALERRPADYVGVSCCSSQDSLADVFAQLKTRRMHRMLVLDDEPDSSRNSSAASPVLSRRGSTNSMEDEGLRTRPKGKLVGLLCLSDILRYIIGNPTAQAQPPVPSPLSNAVPHAVGESPAAAEPTAAAEPSAHP